jgi:hypothetical protein
MLLTVLTIVMALGIAGGYAASWACRKLGVYE